MAMGNEASELQEIRMLLHYILQEFRMMNMISLEKWDNKIEGYDQALGDKETRSAVRDQIKFFFLGYDDIQKKQKEYNDKIEKLWDEKNLKKNSV